MTTKEQTPLEASSLYCKHDVLAFDCLACENEALIREVVRLEEECKERVVEKMDFLTERSELKAEVARLFRVGNEFRDAWDANRIRADKSESALTAANARAERLSKVITDIAFVLDATQELNLSNFDIDDVAQLNDSHIEVYHIIHEALSNAAKEGM